MKDIIQKFLNGAVPAGRQEKILLESSEEIPFEELKGQSLVIAYATQRRRAHSLRSCVFKESHFYLSPKKLHERLSAQNFTAEETPFLLKMLLWENETKTGDREEISLEREEFGLFDTLADNKGEDIYYKKALEDAAAAEVVLIHQYAFARGLHIPGPARNLIITEASRLEDSFINALKKRHTEARLRPFFGDRATLLFGFFGIFHERFSVIDRGGFRGNVILDEELRNSIEWKRIIDAIANLPECEKKTELMADTAPRENTVQWVSSYANEVSFSSAPIEIAKIFHECTAPFKNSLLVSETFGGDLGIQLIRGLFELDANWVSAVSSSRKLEYRDSRLRGNDTLEIKMPEDFPEPYSEGYFKRCIKLFLQIIQEKRGRCLFLLSSKKTVTAMYQTLLPKMPEGVKLLGVGYSGGIGKSVALFSENPESAVLLSTNQILPHLEEIEENIDVIVFQKIPFDPPDDPLLACRAKMFDDGFKEYTLPRAIIKFRDLLAELRASAKNKSKICYLLDSRLKNREYGRLFI